MNVDLHIERLVLDGVPLNRRQSVALKDALECELSRLLEHRGLASVAGISVPFERTFYLHVGLLHGSLLLRIVGA